MRTVVLLDGQNLYHLAREAWAPIPPSSGSPYTYPSYDVAKLAAALAGRVPGRTLTAIRFYTGVPTLYSNPFWHGFWSNKLRFLSSRGIYVYRGRVNPGQQEKGVDVSIAIDLIHMAYRKEYDLAIVVSQDWDFKPAISLAKEIARDQGRTLYFESAFPYEPSRSKSRRGTPGAFWVHIDKALYDSCLDPTDYRPMGVKP